MGIFSLSASGRLDLTAMLVFSLGLIGIISLVKKAHANEADEDEVVANTAFVIWLVTTILSCIMCEGIYLFRAGRCLFIVWMALAIYFLATEEHFAVAVACGGIVTGIVLINLGIYSAEDEARAEPNKDYVFNYQDGAMQPRRNHRYELAVVEDKGDDPLGTDPTTATTEEEAEIRATGADII
ncbi:expressed unknown protein [Seminavis robusta]|uniref:Uncharacterized protein n=1 Tax=Seminavis robusta TaxID=568900 RepID=A0A9N8ETW9_9STRA|nr:expressed unknown protein [Seminavis robusta]CAB9530323.1 expressed unknown protein [Seminavis robusta]|eukprot:Sro2146_g316460.1 n/a (183) ;mRNA; f:16953-17501